MSLEPKSKVEEVNTVLPWKSRSTLSGLHLPRNVYLLLFFTLGKGFQLNNQFQKRFLTAVKNKKSLLPQKQGSTLRKNLRNPFCG